MSEPKILTLDIETAPLNSYHWGLWKENIGVGQIRNEWSILSVAWKWLHEKKPKCAFVNPKNPRNDRELLKIVHALLDEADIVVTQNGIDFDIKKLNARMIEVGLPPYSPIRQIDTKLVAKKHFGFTSNRLEWMGEHIAKVPKSKHKKFPGFELWAECLAGNPAAWKEMITYNMQDVVATEALYLKMRPWIEGHPNVKTYGDMAHAGCPKCGSTKIQNRGYSRTNTGVYHRYQCQTCGGWSRGRLSLAPKGSRATLLGN